MSFTLIQVRHTQLLLTTMKSTFVQLILCRSAQIYETKLILIAVRYVTNLSYIFSIVGVVFPNDGRC